MAHFRELPEDQSRTVRSQIGPPNVFFFCLHARAFIFDRIIIKVAGNQDRHKSSDEFDFGPDPTTHFGVTCP